MTKNIAIKVSNLTKSYKLYSQPIDRVKEAFNLFGKKYHTDFNAVKDLSFQVNKGETVGIIGRNGCGKSTLLKMITSVLTPSSGRVIVHGHISAILELGAGFNPEMTGVENIYLNTSINGLSKDQTDKKIDDIVKFSELGEFIHQPIKTYSSGMNARLAFAVAINVEPDILIVDEALSVGDAAFQRKCFAKMEEIRANGATVLFVSHSEVSIVSLCNRAIWLSNGEQVLDGIPKLVTGLYLKYSNAKQINKEKVLIEYQELKNKDDSSNDISDEITTIEKEKSKNLEELYNPTLKPSSTIYYEENGAKIIDIKITTADNRNVNTLVHGQTYFLCLNVISFQKFERIRFGLHIKNTKGVLLTGNVYPDGEKWKQVKNNGHFSIFYQFKCLLNDGDYFITCGVKNGNTGEFAHRIVDFFMFRVKNTPQYATCQFNSIEVTHDELLLASSGERK